MQIFYGSVAFSEGKRIECKHLIKYDGKVLNYPEFLFQNSSRVSWDIQLYGTGKYDVMSFFKGISFSSIELYCHRKDVRNTG